MTLIQEALGQIRQLNNRRTEPHAVAPQQEIDFLRRSGLLHIVLPGNELCFTKNKTPQLLQLLKAVGRANLSVGRIYEGHINALFLIHLFAAPEQKENWYADAREGCLFGVWNTQAESGVLITQTGSDIFTLSGKKTFASGAGLVQRALVTGHLHSADKTGWQMCIVDMDNLPGTAIDYNSWQPIGMNASVSYTVTFDEYRGRTSDLFGLPDDYYRAPYFGGGAIRFCAVQLGGAEALYNEAIGFLTNLHRTSDPYQGMRISTMATALAAGDLWLQQAGKNWDEWSGKADTHNKLTAFAAMMRGAVEAVCLQVIENTSRCVGARGLMQPYVMEKIVRDLQFYLRQPAPDAVMRQVADFVVNENKTIETMWRNDDDLF